MAAEDDALAVWLRSVQATNLDVTQILNPARAKQPIGAIIEEAGGGLSFDTEPARYTQLLHRLAAERREP